MKLKKRLVYGAVVLAWIIATVYMLTITVVSTDIVNGTCIPYASTRMATLSIFLLIYLFPVILMVFCYSRIVYSLNRKVTATSA